VSGMKRREFITLLGGAAAAWPLAARAQQPGKLPTIGFLGASTSSNWAHWTAAFVRRLGELGWIAGRTVVIDYRWADGRSERLAEIASEFVRLQVDIIVSVGSGAVAAKQVTSSIPIVFAAATDPLGAGLVSSLSRPDGNATGLSMQASDAVGKRLELLRELLPDLCVGWRSLATLTMPRPCEKCLRFGRLPALSASIWTWSKFGAPRTSRGPSLRSRVARRHFMFAPIRW
jgi:ABC transporter substrate binding protein